MKEQTATKERRSPVCTSRPSPDMVESGKHCTVEPRHGQAAEKAAGFATSPDRLTQCNHPSLSWRVMPAQYRDRDGLQDYRCGIGRNGSTVIALLFFVSPSLLHPPPRSTPFPGKQGPPASVERLGGIYMSRYGQSEQGLAWEVHQLSGKSEPDCHSAAPRQQASVKVARERLTLQGNIILPPRPLGFAASGAMRGDSAERLRVEAPTPLVLPCRVVEKSQTPRRSLPPDWRRRYRHLSSLPEVRG